MRISRPITQLMDFNCGQDNGQGRDPVKIIGGRATQSASF